MVLVMTMVAQTYRVEKEKVPDPFPAGQCLALQATIVLLLYLKADWVAKHTANEKSELLTLPSASRGRFD